MTFYFFDLETTGFRPREDRVVQFAGQRTDMELKPIGQPNNFLIKLTDDILPQPDAVLITGITPQATRANGITEAEFVKYFSQNIATEKTIMVGFNNLRFDNEFMRFMLWRNFYDAYEWSWKDNRSTWDLLDVVRTTRALRPDGIKWPFDSNGKPSNKLELLASINQLAYANAHDALSDVNATIDVARMIKDNQPKLFDFLLTNRSKEKVAALVSTGKPVIYTSGRYPSEWEKTTIAAMVAPHPGRAAALMFDLRIDPDEFKDFSPAELAERWQARGEDVPYFPVKAMIYNRSPAVAGDLRVLDKKTQARLKLHMELIDSHYKKLLKMDDFGDKLVAAVELMKRPDQPGLVVDEMKVDGALYDSFVNDIDKTKMRVVRSADANGLADLSLDFTDERLKHLLPLYKARNFPSSLNPEEQEIWQNYKTRRLLDGGDKSLAAAYFRRLNELFASDGLTTEHKYLLEELRLYGESVLPAS